MPFVKTHLNTLKSIQSSHQDQEPVGRIPYDWAKSACPAIKLPKKGLNECFDRKSLLKFCGNKDTETIHAVIAILAWGGMRVNNGEMFLKKSKLWIEAADNVKNGNIRDRKEAFRLFSELRLNNKLPGLGIAYYTKLICFLNPCLNGYIMDQWTSKSINFLTGENLVTFSGIRVNDNNSYETYEKFCVSIEKLANKLKCDPIQAEERIFSKGRKKGAWRTYLIDNYKISRHIAIIVPA